MAKKKIQTPEDIERLVAQQLESNKKDLQKYIVKGFIPNSATRNFEVGQEVVYGAHEKAVVIDKDETGLLYLIHCKYESTSTGSFSSQEKSFDKKYWQPWTDLLPKRNSEEIKNIPQFTERDDMRLSFYQTSLSSFDSIVYHFGIDIEPEYQRGLVWQLEDKQKLIDSIFKGIDIGKFVFIRRDFDEKGALYEILDGKQRLTTIIEYREDRFRFNGLLFSELHPYDQSHIKGYHIATAEITNPTKEQIYKYFLRLNTGGKPIDISHLQKVEGLLKQELDKKGS